MSRAPGPLLLAACLALPAPAAAHIGLQPQTVDLQHPPGADLPLDLESQFAYFVSDDGATWRFTCHEALLADPQNPGTLLPRYVRTGDGAVLVTMGTPDLGFVPTVGVYRSTDGGCDWTGVNDLAGLAITGLAVLADGATVVAGSGAIDGGNGLWRSTDGGASFAPTTVTSLDGYVTSVIAGGPGVAWAASADPGAGTASLHRTDDGGETWTTVPFLEPIEDETPANFRLLAVDPTDADHLHVTSAGQSFDYVHRSADGGTSWVQVHQDASSMLDAAWWGDELVATVGSLRPLRGDGESLTRDADLPFAQGVAARPAGVVLATNALLEDAAIATMDSTGAVTAVFSFEDVTEELACPAGTRHADVCSPIWPDAAVVLALFAGDDDDDDTTAADDDDTGAGQECGCDEDSAAPAQLLLLLGLPILRRRRA